MTRISSILKNRSTRTCAIATAALSGLLTLTAAAPAAGSRDWHHDRDWDHGDHHDRDSRTDVRIDVNIGRPAPRYEDRTTRVWVEPVYRTCTDRVWVEPVTRDECERVWVPDRWERRDVVHGRGRDRWMSCENVLVERGHWVEQHRTVVVCEGHWETRDRQEMVAPGHWEYRTERVCVDDGYRSNNFFDVFARLAR